MIDPSRLLSGTAVLDAPEHVPAVWGSREDVLWAEGEPLVIAGPPGVGKTTLAQQVTLARCGVARDLNVLGYPVTPGEGFTLYVAADRPRQALRSMRRMVRPDQRHFLESLRIWPGPLDALAEADALLDFLATQAVGTVVFDSVKDVAGDTADGKVGAAFNRLLQAIVASGVEVLALHHNRKGQEGNRKPRRLDDLYGSQWIAAGAGSVVYLYGEAGDPVVELLHLKQPAGVVGPLTVVHDHARGRTSVMEGVTALSILEAVGEDGAEVRYAAAEIFATERPTPNQVEKTRRQLDALVRSGAAEKVDGAEPRAPSRYLIRDSRDSERDTSDPHHGSSRNGLSKHHGSHHGHHAEGSNGGHPLKGGRDPEREAVEVES